MSTLELAYDVANKSVVMIDLAQRIATQGHAMKAGRGTAWVDFSELTATDQRLVNRLSVSNLNTGTVIKPYALRAGVMKPDEAHLADLAGIIKSWMHNTPASLDVPDELAKYITKHWPDQ